MKKVFQKLTVLFLMALVLCNFPAAALAAGTVTYDADAQDFIFEPGSNHSPTDLFSKFKDVMPGDQLTEQIEIVHDGKQDIKLKIYMRSLGAQENTDDFLSQMKLTVKQVGDSVLFDAPADQTAQLSDWVCLGTVYPGGKVTLAITLNIPTTMDDTFQNHLGYMDWAFKVEELPVEEGDPQVPQTGDNTNFLLPAVVMSTALAGGVALITGKKKFVF